MTTAHKGVLGLVLLSVRHLRHADLPKSVTGLDQAQQKAVSRRRIARAEAALLANGEHASVEP